MDLDSLLNASAPPVAARDAALHEELTALIGATERAVRPRRRRRRLAIVGGLAATVLAGTVATTAAVGPSAWFSWVGEDHKTCQMDLGVGPAGPDVGNGEADMWPSPFPYARRNRIVADAKAFADTFDYAGIDRAEAIRAWQAEEDRVIAWEKANLWRYKKPGEPVDQPQPRLTGDDLTSMAIQSWMRAKLVEHLAAEGYDMSNAKGSDLFLFVSGAGWSCR